MDRLINFSMRAPEDFLNNIDDWRREQPDLPSRSEAVRRLVETAAQQLPPRRRIPREASK